MDKTAIAVIGFGLIGQRHAEVIRNLAHLSIAAIVEPNEERRAHATELGVPVYSTLAQMFSQIMPDGVVLATPTPLHVEQGLACVANHCPVLIEKPIAVTALHARTLTDAAESANVPILVGHHRRHSGKIQAAKEALVSGAIGEVRAVQASCWLYKPNHYFQVAPWRTRKGAGPISVNLVHDVDLLRHLCGEVSTVQAVSMPAVRGYENEDLATAILTFQSGAVATISVSDSIVAPWSWELTAHENPVYPATNQSCYLLGGSTGGLSLPDMRLWRYVAEPDWWTPIHAHNMSYCKKDPLIAQMEHFAKVVKGLESPLVSGVEGMRSLQVVEAVAVSADQGTAVELNFASNTDLYGPSASETEKYRQ